MIILSGGMDSVTLLYDYKERIALAVSFDYGSNHNAREIPFAKQHCGQQASTTRHCMKSCKNRKILSEQ